MKKEISDYLDEIRETENKRIFEKIQNLGFREREIYMNAYSDAVVYCYKMLKKETPKW